jgi:hypothetical protein
VIQDKGTQSSQSFTDTDVSTLVQKLKQFHDGLQEEKHKALLYHLIAGAETFFDQPINKEEVIIMDKEIGEAAQSALQNFIDTEKGTGQPSYKWIRRS